MGLFDKIKKRKSNDSVNNADILADVFRTICSGEEIAAAEIAGCTRSTMQKIYK